MALTRAGYEKFTGSLPATTIVEQWESSCAKVGGKVFALFGLKQRAVVFKVSETSFAGLTSLEGVAQAAYFARGRWVSVGKGALPDGDLKAYLCESHRLIAMKLTRRARAELGLDA